MCGSAGLAGSRGWLMVILGVAAASQSLPASASSPRKAAPAPAGDLHRVAAAARSILGRGQGVYIEAADGTVLLAQNASKPVHPASVSKVPTTLALLRQLGPDHRFVTTFASDGRVVDGTLQGDLRVRCDGDPLLVDEDALLVAERLKQAGVLRIAGQVRLESPLTFNWQPALDGTPLRQALAGRTRPAAWHAVQALQYPEGQSPLTELPGVTFMPGLAVSAGSGGAVAIRTDTTPAPEQSLVVHRSQPLLSLVKSLNDYSNNIFAHLAENAGGAAAVEKLARSVVPADMADEITLGDGAGADPSNRLSPRAAVKLLRALEQQLVSSGHTLAEALPVAGIDDGTLHERLDGPQEVGRVVGKTGTFDEYGASALVGAIRTAGRGTVYFAILDHDIPAVKARPRQDRFVRVLLSSLHGLPWGYQPDARPSFARAQIEALHR
jgi:D-alanyl-D-alanine carboxypeptidase/D-alanyl-D-alanine-endopeptidase (penicillin-binding protein 4)